jgi:plastocyanin
MKTRQLLKILAGFLAALPWYAGHAASISITVTDSKGGVVENAAIYALPLSTGRAPILERTVEIDQVNKEFVPYLSIITPADTVSFPNSDHIRHHVYSFSETKKFEIPLYGGAEIPSIQFENTGVVALGCNVHDWMRAYVLVVDTPYHAITNTAGLATLELQAGEFDIHVWHPELKNESEDYSRKISVAQDPVAAEFTIERKKLWRAWRSSDEFEEGY